MKQMKINIMDHKKIRTIRKYYNEESGSLESKELNELERKLLKHKRFFCYQSEWMGRSCYKSMQSDRYVNIKGCGPGPGSEHMREYLNEMWSQKSNGGCFRLETNTQYPLLVQFKRKKSSWEIFDPRPEGASIFGAVLREAEAANICNKLGLNIIQPKIVLRNNITSPWEKEGIDVKEYLLKEVPKALSSHLGIPELRKENISLEKICYTNMDSGLLVRTSRTPYRLSNLHEASTSEDYESINKYADHLENDLRIKDIKGAIEFYSSSFARNASILFNFGIIHGQFGVHYQNISLAGELADFDSTIFVNNLNVIPTGIIKESSYIKEFNKTIAGLDKKLDTNMMYYIRENRNYVKDNSKDIQTSQAAIAGRLLREIHDLYIQGFRAVDLSTRAKMTNNINNSGTVLEEEMIRMFRQQFIKHFFDNLETDRSFIWCYEKGKERLLERYLNKLGNHTIYGWYQEGIPNYHFTTVCDRVRQKFILKEAEGLFDSMIKVMN